MMSLRLTILRMSSSDRPVACRSAAVTIPAKRIERGVVSAFTGVSIAAASDISWLPWRRATYLW
jgi:hypothetical protein